MNTFKVGPYTIRHRQEPGRQCPLYCVFLDDVLIGKCISVPDEDACRWLERQQREQTFYAYSSAPLPDLTKRRELTNPRGTNQHNRKRGAPRKAETLQDIVEALAGG